MFGKPVASASIMVLDNGQIDLTYNTNSMLGLVSLIGSMDYAKTIISSVLVEGTQIKNRVPRTNIAATSVATNIQKMGKDEAYEAYLQLMKKIGDRVKDIQNSDQTATFEVPKHLIDKI